MKLGEALTLRARQAQKLNDLQGRIKSNAMVQEGTSPQESAYALIEEYVTTSDAHAELITRIIKTNAATPTGGSGTLLELLQERQRLQRKRNIYRLAADAAAPERESYRYMRTELKYVPQLDGASLRGEVDAVDEALRAMDAEIQELNWQIDLL